MRAVRRRLGTWVARHAAFAGLARMAPTLGTKVELYVTALLLSRQREPGRRRRWRRVTVGCHGRRVTFHVDDFSELRVLHEVFAEEIYALDGLTPRVIFDLGSNIGASVLYFRVRYPEARIHAFEPDPGTFAKLAAATRGWEGIEISDAAVSASDGTRAFFRSEESWTSSLVLDDTAGGLATGGTSGSAAASGEVVEVRARGLDSLMHEAGVDHIDLLKIDIEGGEWELLGHVTFEGVADTIIGELHFVAGALRDDDVRRALPGFDVSITHANETQADFLAVRRAIEAP